MTSRSNDQMAVDLEKGIDSPESFSLPETGSFLAYRDDSSGLKDRRRVSSGLLARITRLYRRNPSTMVRGRYSITFRQIISITGFALGALVLWTYVGTQSSDSEATVPATVPAGASAPSDGLERPPKDVKEPSSSGRFVYPLFEAHPDDPPTARDRWERVRGKGTRSTLKKIQHVFQAETESERATREMRRKAVREGFLHAWNGYKQHAWGHDEVYPVTGMPKDNFGGWGATMIDSLDTLLIMGLNTEFDEALQWVKIKFDMTKNPNAHLQFFETVIRYLGGLLSAYDLSGEKVLLDKAGELGQVLLNAFKHSEFPASRFSVNIAHQPVSNSFVLAEVGSIQLEFTRLSMLSGNPVYDNKARRIIDILSNQTSDIKGIFPQIVSPTSKHYSQYSGHVGGMTDSYYEYLIKEWILLDGKAPMFKQMFEDSVDSMADYLVSRPADGSKDYAIIGRADSTNKHIQTSMDHLTCFMGGSLAMGAAYFDRPQDLELARQVTEACYLSYHYSATGVGPEIIAFDGKAGTSGKFFKPKLPGTFYERGWSDESYILRPETVESLWVLYRLTGDKRYPEQAWQIFQALEKSCRTKVAYSGLSNVNVLGSHNNNMESFFLAETMKYLYLMFSTPDVISLDDFVLNTEAHPLRRT
ncbi:hypothetical protein DFQ27_006396 [Actinomortierella ambigua]|uniref:alpha-1,2-Mannosidase n=1 Tax=Actinomortierella ambigua TaxID=1343610 RepID=A0A9P6PY68_9FUNG|nr:hypothetical protein DFQ27_006396 [Actinomortierella ambigua]